jgi:hypothetical protein
MRKRFALLWTLLALGAALALPASTAAGSPGSIGFVGGFCSGSNTVNATFKLIKNSGYHATHLTMTAKGQGYHNGGWRTEYEIGTWTKDVFTNSRATMKREFWYDPAHTGKHRILVIGKIWDGGVLIASGKEKSGFCS